MIMQMYGKLLDISHSFGDGPVVNLDDRRFRNNGIIQAIGRTNRPIPVKAGGVRSMSAVTFHGSTDNATKTRWVLFPWYTRVNTTTDETVQVSRSYETDALEPVEDYAASVTTLISPPTTGGGQFPKNTKLPYRFPPQSSLLPGCLISAAITGLVPWDQPAVTAEVREFFRNPYVSIRRQKRDMARAMRWHMILFRQAEMEAFGEDSFYVRHPERAAVVPEIRDDWSDAMDEMYAHHACVRDHASGNGPYGECLGNACMAERPGRPGG